VIIDAHVSLSRWPFRRLRGDETPDLVAALRRHGVGQAWAGSFDGMLHKDLASVNTRLASECRTHGRGLLVPFGSVNPMLPDWQEDLRRCHEEHEMPGILLQPNYHGYDLKSPVAREVLSMTADRGLIVQMALRMEDERMQHPLVRVAPVDPAPLPGLVREVPKLRLVVMHWKGLLNSDLLRRLSSTGRVYFEISTMDGLDAFPNLLENASADRILFASNFPLFYFEAALFKVREASLTETQRQSIFEGNARRLLSNE
jgi:predicted TIM-barrel fold metal-dependent hydrolase